MKHWTDKEIDFGPSSFEDKTRVKVNSFHQLPLSCFLKKDPYVYESYKKKHFLKTFIKIKLKHFLYLL